MGVVRLSKSEITDYQKYSSMLAGNPAFSPSAFDLLETTVLGTAAATVTFSGLGSYSDYKHLQIRAVVGGNFDIGIQFNSDTGSNYAGHLLRGNGSNVASGALAPSSFMYSYFDVAPNISTNPGILVLDLLDFSSTSKNKTIRSMSGQVNATASNRRIYLNSGFRNSTSAVTSILLDGSGGNFSIGSRFSLYGIK